jgi:long-chain fatty acid transport protein
MYFRPFRSARFIVLTLVAAAACTSPAFGQAGLVLTGAGPVNRSMGGAATAAPIDATGALYWNPATTTALPGSSIDFGVELLLPHTTLSSSLPANSLGLGIPPIGLSGSDRSDAGAFALPSMAVVYRPEDSLFTFGLGIFPVGGFGVNYAASTTNPILTPQPPVGLGFGALYAQLAVLQVAPTVAVQLTDRLSFGIGPTVNLATLSADPFFGAAPDDANGDGFATYPSATHSRVTWGGGFQAGLFLKLDEGWQLGASIKSPQWFEDFRWQSTNEIGGAREVSFHFDFPMITSVGVGYTGFDNWILAADFRYVDFRNTAGFRQSGFAPDGAVQGLGWRSIFAMALGAQYQATDCLSLRAGYTFNQNPISDAQSSFNSQSPTILMHAVYVGLSYKVSDALSLSLAYAHGFENAIDGPLVTPLGSVPGTSVRSQASADTLLFGASVRFGGCPKGACEATACNQH